MNNETKQKEYVCGFLFSREIPQVLLIEKRRPDWQAGLLNGIGGGIEDGETSLEAMQREFKEETGLEISKWLEFCTLYDNRGWTIHFFYVHTSFNNMHRCKQLTDEKLRIIHVNDIRLEVVIPNLNWLIPMVININKDNTRLFIIKES